MGNLDGKIALVTGASAGIGEQTTRILVDAGTRVICAARRLPRLESLVAELGDTAIALELDVTNEASVATLLERLPAGQQQQENGTGGGGGGVLDQLGGGDTPAPAQPAAPAGPQVPNQ